MITIAGWDLSIEVAARGTDHSYDDPEARYGVAIYGGAGGLPAWVEIPEITNWSCIRDVPPAQGLGAVAVAGRFQGNMYDPDRSLDPTYANTTVLQVGAPLRVVARKGAVERILWLGTIDSWRHDTLTGDGSVAAADLVTRLAAVPVVDHVRPEESAGDRVEALVGLLPDVPVERVGEGGWLCGVVTDGDLWSVLRLVVDTDGSWLWTGTDGAVHWQPRSRGIGQPVEFTDVWDGSTAVMTGLPTKVSDDQVVNIVEAQRIYPKDATAPPPVVIGHAASQQQFDPQRLTNTQLQVTTDAEVLQWAEDVLEARAWPVPAPVELVTQVHSDLIFGTATMDSLAALDLGRPIRVSLTSRGDPQTWEAAVNRIEFQADTEILKATVGFGGALRIDPAGNRYDQARYDYANYGG